jgi:hypothetical protein
VEAGGGVSNHAEIGAGRVDLGIANPPMTAAALAGRAPYDEAYPALRVGVANLTVTSPGRGALLSRGGAPGTVARGSASGAMW